MDRVLAMGVISVAPPPAAGELPLKGLSFCFTGELKKMKRNQAEEKVKALGGSAKTTVAKDLSYLVTNDPESGSSKNQKALELGVKIIDEDAFLALIDIDGNAEKAGKPVQAAMPKNREPEQRELF
jgi:DNA ligase (NAD+)